MTKLDLLLKAIIKALVVLELFTRLVPELLD